MEVTTKCPFCGKTTVVKVNQTGYEAWKNGMHIQDALPELSANEREMLISGICPECWDELFKED